MKKKWMCLCISVHKAAIKAAAYHSFKMKQNRVNESWEKKVKVTDKNMKKDLKVLFPQSRSNLSSKLINE